MASGAVPAVEVCVDLAAQAIGERRQVSQELPGALRHVSAPSRVLRRRAPASRPRPAGAAGKRACANVTKARSTSICTAWRSRPGARRLKDAIVLLNESDMLASVSARSRALMPVASRVVHGGLVLHQVVLQQLLREAGEVVVAQGHGGAHAVLVVALLERLGLPPVRRAARHAQLLAGGLHRQALGRCSPRSWGAFLLRVCHY